MEMMHRPLPFSYGQLFGMNKRLIEIGKGAPGALLYIKTGQ